MKNWVALSSSSGQTFKSVWRALNKEEQSSFKGLFLDRKCEAPNTLKGLVPAEKIFDFSDPTSTKEDKRCPTAQFEARYLQWLQDSQLVQNQQPIVFLIGYFKILSPGFLEKAGAVVNTHPSLLPLFPGMDHKVHQMAFDNCLVSGFSIHMVNEDLDAGPLLFQKTIETHLSKSPEELRDNVRSLEQQYLGPAIKKILQTNIDSNYRKLSTRELQLREGFPICVD